METVPKEFMDLIERETFAHLATVDSNGVPHIAPVWIGSGNGELHVVTRTTSQKYRNIESNEKVALSIIDPDDPYRSLIVRGKVVTVDSAAGLDRLDEFA
jgi:nitroimidazol reductase NimA-like FMN-containing flavoprotein (pyridoxamine 5'-phosphate oxidase superfamily)